MEFLDLVLYALLLLALYFVLLVLSPLIVLLRLKIQLGPQAFLDYKPLLGVFARFQVSERKFNDALYELKTTLREKPQVKVILTNLFCKPLLIIADPEWQRLMYSQHEFYPKYNTIANDKIFHKGVIMTNGQKWRDQRTILRPALSHDKLKALIPMIHDVVKKHLFKEGVPLDQIMVTITGETVVRSFFGEDQKDAMLNGKPAQVEFSSIIDELFTLQFFDVYCSLKKAIIGPERANKYFLSKAEASINKRIDEARGFAEKIITARVESYRANGIPEGDKDSLGLYVEAYMKQKDGSIDFDEIIQQFLTFFFAGTDTTALTATSCLFFLASDPRIQEDLREEMSQFEEINEKNIGQLVKLQGFINEILRLKNPSYYSIVKLVNQDHQLSSIGMKKDWLVVQGQMLSSWREEYFENAKSFDYKRWLGQEPIKGGNSSYYNPFGGGARNCIGQHLAQIELKIIIVNFLKAFKLSIDESITPRWVIKGLYGLRDAQMIRLEKR